MPTLRLYSVNFLNDALQNPSLSWAAKGLLATIIAFLDEGERISIARLSTVSSAGMHATRTAMNDLIAAGYVTRYPVQAGWEYDVVLPEVRS
jgi:hypothetical protein